MVNRPFLSARLFCPGQKPASTEIIYLFSYNRMPVCLKFHKNFYIILKSDAYNIDFQGFIKDDAALFIFNNFLHYFVRDCW